MKTPCTYIIQYCQMKKIFTFVNCYSNVASILSTLSLYGLLLLLIFHFFSKIIFDQKTTLLNLQFSPYQGSAKSQMFYFIFLASLLQKTMRKVNYSKDIKSSECKNNQKMYQFRSVLNCRLLTTMDFVLLVKK